MRPLFTMLLLAALAIGAAIFMRQYPGTVHIEWGPYMMSTSIYIMLFISAALLFGVMLLWGMVRTLLGLPSRFSMWRSQRHDHKALAALTQAVLAQQQGKHGAAEKAARLAHEHPETAAIAAWVGCQAATARSDFAAVQTWREHLKAHPEFLALLPDPTAQLTDASKAEQPA